MTDSFAKIRDDYEAERPFLNQERPFGRAIALLAEREAKEQAQQSTLHRPVAEAGRGDPTADGPPALRVGVQVTDEMVEDA
jgi:hypothetical protein